MTQTIDARTTDGPQTTTAPTTVLPRELLPPLELEPARVRVGASAHERYSVPGSIAAAVSTALLLGPVLGMVGMGWVPLMSFVFFIVFYSVLISITEDKRAVTDRFWQVMLWSTGALVTGVLAMVIGYVFFRGWGVYRQMDWTDLKHNFIASDMGLTGPLAPITSGGVFHALVGTLEQIGIALAISVPLGIATALFLSEVKGRFARFVRTVVEAMTALPSVVAGLFIYATIILLFTKERNGIAAALALTVLMLPIMIRSADVVLRLVPGNLREAGLALGGGQWAVVRHVVLPTVRSGLTTAIILGTAHGIGETAPVLLTAGATSNTNWNPFSGPQTSLPLQALEFIKAPQPSMVTRGFATAALLLIVVLILFTLARVIGGQRAGELTARQLRRRMARSRRDQSRVESNHQVIRDQIELLRAAHTLDSRGDHSS
ncbi:ABC transporter permease subunit [Nocardioides sp. WS12]|uniref:PstA family ABC transporter permease n=1 Tax=Nocardioides sp. WS12 TaxID=2486272 RepID=UPI0015FB67A2|nr:ABC transporter permease subunit [Nocardioides sp. WS12]